MGINNVGTRSRRGRTRVDVALDMTDAEEDVITDWTENCWFAFDQRSEGLPKV